MFEVNAAPVEVIDIEEPHCLLFIIIFCLGQLEMCNLNMREVLLIQPISVFFLKCNRLKRPHGSS